MAQLPSRPSFSSLELIIVTASGSRGGVREPFCNFAHRQTQCHAHRRKYEAANLRRLQGACTR